MNLSMEINDFNMSQYAYNNQVWVTSSNFWGKPGHFIHYSNYIITYPEY